MRKIAILSLTLIAGCVSPDKQFTLINNALTESRKIEYRDEKDKDYWQTPSETEKIGSGDCEDKAFYLNHLLKNKGVKSRIVFGLLESNRPYMHAWNEIDISNQTYLIDTSSKIPIFIERSKIGDYKYVYEYNEYIKDKMTEYNKRLKSRR